MRRARARRRRVQDAAGQRRDVARVARRASQALPLLRGIRGAGGDDGCGGAAHSRGRVLSRALVLAVAADGRFLGDVGGLVNLHRRRRRRRRRRISPPAVLGQLHPRRLLPDGALDRIRGLREPALEQHLARVLRRARERVRHRAREHSIGRGLVHRLPAKVPGVDEQIHDRPYDLGAVRVLLGADRARVQNPQAPRLLVPQPPADGPAEQVSAAARLAENQRGARAFFFRGARGRAGSAGPPGTPLAVHPGGGAFPFALRARLDPKRRPVAFVHVGDALAEGLHREPKRARDVRDAHASLASRRAQRHEAVLHARLKLHRFPAHGFQKGFPRQDAARLVTSGTVERVVGFRGAEAARTRRRLGAGERRRRQTQRVHRHESRLARFRVRHGRVRLGARGDAALDEPLARAREQLVHLRGDARVPRGPLERAALAPERLVEHARELPVRHHALRRRRAL